jgi:hypothetical protein
VEEETLKLEIEKHGSLKSGFLGILVEILRFLFRVLKVIWKVVFFREGYNGRGKWKSSISGIH